jgi:hypothetical protein
MFFKSIDDDNIECKVTVINYLRFRDKFRNCRIGFNSKQIDDFMKVNLLITNQISKIESELTIISKTLSDIDTFARYGRTKNWMIIPPSTTVKANHAE